MRRGNGASVLRIVPYAALHFSAYESYREALVRAAAAAAHKPLCDFVVPPYLDLIAGSAAGATAVMVLSSSLTNSRLLHTRPVTSRWNLKRRCSAMADRAGAHRMQAGTCFACSDRRAGQQQRGKEVPAWAQVTYPLDLVRTRLAYGLEGAGGNAAAERRLSGAAASAGPGSAAAAALQQQAARQQGHHHAATIRSVLANTVRQEGLLGLYRGIGPTLCGILPYAGLKFYVYQSLKQQYRRRALSCHHLFCSH